MSSAGKSFEVNKPLAPGNPGVEAAVKPPLLKALVLASVMGLLLIVVYFSPLRDYLGRFREVSDRIKSMDLLAPFVLTLGVALLVAAGFPRLLFCVIAGMALDSGMDLSGRNWEH